MPRDPANEVIRFGIFEVELRAGRLRRNGLKVRLQEQPFQVLAMLLERPGEVVTREDLRARLWPADTFVDFDHGLNAAVKRLRDALGDSAENPRFVETLARRGYRFLAPMEFRSAVSPGARAWSARNNTVPIAIGSRWRLLAAGSIIVLLALGFGLHMGMRASRALQPLLKSEIKGIIRIQLEGLRKMVAKNGIDLQFSDYALDFLAENGFDPQFGARPLKRLIQKEIVNQLSKKILSGDVDRTHPVLVDVFDGVVVFRNETNKTVTDVLSK